MRRLLVVLLVPTLPVLVLLGLRARIALGYREPIVPPPVPGVVCGADARTYGSEAEARTAGVVPLHAGACGACSNAADVEVLRRTRSTLTETARGCGMRYLFLGRAAAATCMATVGFTGACADCWLDDMACAVTHCMGTCLVSRLGGEPNNVEGALNDCLACDETNCGPEFVRCAGANRRRAGIVSDIARPDSQVWQGGGRESAGGAPSGGVPPP